MKKKMIKLIVMTALFFGALITFSITMNQDNQDLTTTMREAGLPILYFYHGDTRINELHGYVEPMDMAGMRDCITPIGEDWRLKLAVRTCGCRVDGIRYEIRSMDGERLVAKNDVSDYETKNGEIQAQLAIQNLLEADEEYMMLLAVNTGGREISYYTRLMRSVTGNADESLAFALEFHEHTFGDNADRFIPTYMDPATGDATTLNYVDLSCTLKQITWADFEGELLTEAMVSFKEINGSYNALTLTYVMSSVNSAGETELYNVEEYYRLRLTPTRMYVLNFERRMNQIFSGENTIVVDGRSIQLGIRDEDIQYMSSETGDVIAFVQEGELWCFDRLSGKIVQVFSFRSTEGIDPREIWNRHDIKIVDVDEAGSVDFVVYGYMNRGEHEGRVGIGVYHYDGLVHTVEEQVFIPYNKSYEVLKADMGQLMYVGDQGNLYLMMDGDVYSIDLETLALTTPVRGLKDSCYKTSPSNRYFAWVEPGSEYRSESIHLMDLSDGTDYEVTAEAGMYLSPLGFINEDFIYGEAEKEKVVVDAAGNTLFPMSSLKIMETGEEHAVLKDYRPAGGKIGSIDVEDYTITVNLIKKSAGRYAASGTESIMNRVADTENRVTVGQSVTEVKQRQYQLVMSAAIDPGSLKYITSKIAVQEEPRIITFKEHDRQERFYVYVNGKVTLATDRISDAIIQANEDLGVVVDANQQYVWMRASKTVQNAFTGLAVNDSDKDASSVVQAVSALLEYRDMGVSVKELIDSGATPKSAIEMTLKDSVVLDVSGCTIKEILFYISIGSPVLAMTGSDSAVLVTGYNSSVIYYFEPISGRTDSMTYEEADELFEQAGNIFFTYMDY